MALETDFLELLESGTPQAFEQFTSDLDENWIYEAIEETGKLTIRKRKILASQGVWLVIGMGLFRDRSIVEVMSHLSLVLPRPGEERGSVASSSISNARGRIGPEPLKVLFEGTGRKWAHQAAQDDSWRGLGLYASDGTTFRVQDTEVNRSTYGSPSGKNGSASYPQLRLVAVLAARSHLICAVNFGPYQGKQTGEQALMKPLWDEVPDNSLIIVDKGFFDLGPLYLFQIKRENRHWLVPAKKNTRWKTIKKFADGDELVELNLSDDARKKYPGLPSSMRARAIFYQHGDHEPRWLLTSLVNPDEYPAQEVIELYHERWEAEIGYDEIKTHMLERKEALRSKSPERVSQELWGILIAYNLIRLKMREAASYYNVPANRISFRHSLQLIRIFCLIEAWTTAPSKLPARLGELTEMVGLLLLPSRRSERSYERVVKRKPKKYKNAK